MSDAMQKIRLEWAREKAAGHWDEDYLEQERKARRANIEQLREREEPDVAETGMPPEEWEEEL